MLVGYVNKLTSYVPILTVITFSLFDIFVNSDLGLTEHCVVCVWNSVKSRQ